MLSSRWRKDQSINNKKASVVTDEIDCFTSNGIKLKSGDELSADLVDTGSNGLTWNDLAIALIVDKSY